MNQEPIKKDFFIYVASYLLLLFLTMFFPLAMVLLPIPIVLLVKGYSVKWSAIGGLIFLIFASFVIPVFSLPVTLLAIISGGMIGWSIKQGQHPYETWAKGTTGFVLGLVLIYVYIEVVLQISIIDTFNQTMDESLQMTAELFKTVGLEQNLDQVREEVANLLQLLPVILAVISMVMAIITQWISYKLINKVYKEKLYFPPFRNFQLPKVILWLYFIILVISFFALDPSTTAWMIITNIYQLAGILMALQGLSFLFFYSYTKKKSLVLPILAIVLVIIYPFMGLYLLRILGIIDLGFEMRKRMAK
ncbi:DUF2232 domain-containing protein [Gracilibacillus sp. S3-1-1]|uniref:DUF2232 domain-containing protein n=1 Tax=Gracilibacillus pellucidus TaxID=3095368 RepID=A0ACC6M3E5_9BACI|nr:DUF2232 domain-containing protein [Gracilibacillus sp. S3-1-1]MDX8045423.1 DUF2232 domain-containing protein [Gracilibacillus sp. S3-1-1]